jgi:hypothetical protein
MIVSSHDPPWAERITKKTSDNELKQPNPDSTYTYSAVRSHRQHKISYAWDLGRWKM